MYDKGRFFKATFQPGIKPEYNFFKIRTNCPIEMMLRRARRTSDRTSDKTF